MKCALDIEHRSTPVCVLILPLSKQTARRKCAVQNVLEHDATVRLKKCALHRPTTQMLC